MDCFACRKYFEVLQRCVWTQTTQDFSFYKFSFLCKGRRVLGSNATYPIILPWCAETIWNWRVKHARKKNSISTYIHHNFGNKWTVQHRQQAFSRKRATATRAQALATLRSPAHAPHCSTNHRQWNQLTAVLFRSIEPRKKRFCMLLWQAICYIGIHRLHLKSFFKRISCDRSFGRVMPTYFYFSAFFGSGLGSLQERFSQSSPFLTTNSP